MSARTTPLSPALEAELARLRPVRPLPPPWRRAAWLVPVALVSLSLAWRRFGWRFDWPELGLLGGAGLSALQALAGLALVAAGLREAVPGRAHGGRALALLGVGGALLLPGVTLATWALSGTRVPAGLEAHYWRVCFAGAVRLGVPLLLIATVLMARAWPARPRLTGMLCGLGCGLLVDSGWRLLCEVADPAHVLSAHGLAVASLAALGSVLGGVVGGLAQRRLSTG